VVEADFHARQRNRLGESQRLCVGGACGEARGERRGDGEKEIAAFHVSPDISFSG
jgi:hypothetical protein